MAASAVLTAGFLDSDGRLRGQGLSPEYHEDPIRRRLSLDRRIEDLPKSGRGNKQHAQTRSRMTKRREMLDMPGLHFEDVAFYGLLTLTLVPSLSPSGSWLPAD
jgi:hypothetical protein